MRIYPSHLLQYSIVLIIFASCASTSRSLDFSSFDEPPLPVGGNEAIVQNIPLEIRKSSNAGLVLISVFIDTAGIVTEIQSLGSHSELHLPVAQAIKNTSWKSARLEAKKVGVWVNIPVRIESGEALVHYPLYDRSPVPVGGYKAILSNLSVPEIAMAAGLHGTVIVQALVSVNGKVTKVSMQKSMPNTGLDQAAIEAIKKTAFTPAMFEGEAIDAWIAIPIKY